MIHYSKYMSKLTARSKFVISISVVFAFVGATYLLVGIFKDNLPSGGIRNSTDEIGQRVLLSHADFLNNVLDNEWESNNNPFYSEETAVFSFEGQDIRSPSLNNAYAKYVEINVLDIQNSVDGVFLLEGYDKDNNLLEQANLEVTKTGISAYRFAYDHVFIEHIVVTYLGQETSVVVDNIAIYALQ